MDHVHRIFSIIQNYWKWTRYIAIQTLAKIAEFIALSCLALYYMVEAVVWSMMPSFLIPEKSIRGKVVLVTGGAGGLGQELVLRLARQDARVVVWDNNEKAMAELAEKTKNEGHLIHTYPVDVTDREVVYKYAKMVKEDIGPIDILINNAGIVCGQTFLDIPDYMIEKTFKVNILAHYWTVKAFLPDMMKRKEGHIVTVGSLTGMLGTYKCTDYSASKFATVGFHESLSTELKTIKVPSDVCVSNQEDSFYLDRIQQLQGMLRGGAPYMRIILQRRSDLSFIKHPAETHGHHNINMTLICPYFINTGMFDGCKPKNFPMLEPRDVAKRIITAIKREEVFITLPAFSRFVIPLKNYLPSKLGWALMIRVIKGPQSMMGMRSFKEIEAA